MKSIIIIAISAASICLTAPLSMAAVSSGQNTATGPVESKVKSVCQTCHGLQGDSVSTAFPRLNGQKAEYVTLQLKNFRDHKRTDPHAQAYMWGMASQLDDTMIAGLAKYYESQKPTQPQTGGALASQGQKIFLNGIAGKDVPACRKCHGENGEGAGMFPRLAGQHADYLRIQLGAFRSTLRTNGVMHANTKDMTNSDIEALVSFLANE